MIRNGQNGESSCHSLTFSLFAVIWHIVPCYKQSNTGLWQGSASKISWPDSDFQGHKTNLGTSSCTKYYQNQLSADWNEDVDFIIATGHGGWFKRKLVRNSILYTAHKTYQTHNHHRYNLFRSRIMGQL